MSQNAALTTIAIAAGFLAAPFLARRKSGPATLLLTLGAVASIALSVIVRPFILNGAIFMFIAGLYAVIAVVSNPSLFRIYHRTFFGPTPEQREQSS